MKYILGKLVQLLCAQTLEEKKNGMMLREFRNNNSSLKVLSEF